MSTWIATSLVIPAGVSLAIGQLAPPPSRVAYVDASREAMDAFYANEPKIYSAYLAARPQLSSATPALLGNSAIKRFARDEAYRAPLHVWEQRFNEHAQRVESFTSPLRLLSPALVMETVLHRAAGTDAASYERFAEKSRQYTAQLRQFFEPIVLANAVRGEKWSCANCPGRLNFSEYERVPRFVPEESQSLLTAGTISSASFVWLAAATLTLVARLRLRRWPL